LTDANRRKIAELVTEEHAKTLPDALEEVARGLETERQSSRAMVVPLASFNLIGSWHGRHQRAYST